MKYGRNGVTLDPHEMRDRIAKLEAVIRESAVSLEIMCQRGTAKDPGVLGVAMILRDALRARP